MQKIQLSLEVAEVNQILAALGKLPYADVYTLIGSIQQQAAPQLENQSAPDAEAHDADDNTES